MIEVVGFGLLVPACVAAGVAWVLLRLQRSAGTLLAGSGLACGFLAGYALAVDGEWIPERNWHWLPYLAVASSAVGAVAAGHSFRRRQTLNLLLKRALPVLFLILSLTASVALVPDWTDRTIQVPALAAFLLALLLFYHPLPQRVAVASLLPLLILCGLATSAFLAASISLTYAQLACLSVAAFAGSAIVLWFNRDTPGFCGLLPAWVVLQEGTAYVGCIYPNEPIYGLLIPPAVPLVLWVFCCGPLSRLTGLRRTLCEYGLVLLILAGTAAVLFAGSMGQGAADW